MLNYKHVVEQVLSEFKDLVVPNAQEEEGKAQVTRIVALRCFDQDHRTGLLAKTTGNNVNGRSVDILIDGVDGSSADCCSSEVVDPEHRRITAVWVGYVANPDPAWIARYIIPSDAIAEEPGPLELKDAPAPGPDPEPEPTPDEPMPPMPTAWSDAPFKSLEWYSEGGHALDALYCNLLTPHDATELRHADPGGWGNWWFHIVEEEWTVDQVADAIRQEDEYKAAHPEGTPQP